ncbi:MAG: 2-C-methyl-D-erythritol 2,4-cyclodiphosphate synthase [Balneolaceae bacterium]
MNIRVGLGFDVHQFEDGNEIILGGISIPFNKKLKGHSDADVLLHSIADALLGALALGDIGTHFPDSDEAYKNADSGQLLKQVYQLVNNKGYQLGNVDATVVAELPKLNPHMDSIRKKIADLLNCSIEQISVKATTNEKLGFIGREEGLSVHSVVLIERIAL